MEEQLGRFVAEVERPEPLKFAWPIIVLPELFTTARHLGVLVGYLATIGWEVYAPDLRAGIGDPAAQEKLRFDDFVGLAVEALSALGRDAVIVGHGLGGLVALKLAENPKVKAAVAMAPLVPGFPTPLFGGIRNRISIWRGHTLSPPSGRIAFEFVADADPFQRAQIIKTMVAGATAAALEIVRGDMTFAQPGAGAPRLIVAGDSDKFAPYAKVEEFANRIGARLAKIRGRGHWLVGGRALEASIGEIQRFLVRSLGQDLLLLYPEEWKREDS